MDIRIEKIRKIFSNVFVVMALGYFSLAASAFAIKATNTAGITGHTSAAANTTTPSASSTGSSGSTGSTGGTLAEPDSQTIGVGVAIPGTGIESKGEYKFSVYVRALYAFSMKVAIALATLMVVYAGYKYLTSRGESGAINEAKDILFSTLMGAALLMLVVLIAHIAGLELNIGSTSVSTSSLPLLTIFS